MEKTETTVLIWGEDIEHCFECSRSGMPFRHPILISNQYHKNVNISLNTYIFSILYSLFLWPRRQILFPKEGLSNISHFHIFFCNVTLTLPYKEVESNSPLLESGWTWDRFDQQNTVEVRLYGFQGWVIRDDAVITVFAGIVMLGDLSCHVRNPTVL